MREVTEIMGLKDPASENGEKVHTKQGRVLEIARGYYEGLYTPETVNESCQRKLLELLEPAPELSEPRLVEPVRATEVATVLNQWSMCKVPGPDGIPYEWYKRYADCTRVKSSLVRILLCVMNVLLLGQDGDEFLRPEQWAQGVISVLYKKGEREDIRNYRPLSMINAVYKMLTTILNNRIIVPISQVIGVHQTGFLPDRQIFDSVKLVQCLIDRASQLGEDLYVVLLDQEKAYDRVNHGFLWMALTKIGLPPCLLRAIQNCYHEATSRVAINGHLSQAFSLKRGVRQGDPISCLLFDIVIEPLAQLIVRDELLKGFTASDGTITKVAMYADDTTVFLRSVNEWKRLKDLYGIYKKGTNASLNEKKTEVIGVSLNTNRPSHLGGSVIQYEGQSVRYLGAPVGLNIDYGPKWACTRVRAVGSVLTALHSQWIPGA